MSNINDRQDARLDAIEEKLNSLSENTLEHNADEIATLRADFEEMKLESERIKETLGSRDHSEFATKEEVLRVSNELERLNLDRAENPDALTFTQEQPFSTETDAFPRGLMGYIIETYFREDLRRYELDLVKRRGE